MHHDSSRGRACRRLAERGDRDAGMDQHEVAGRDRIDQADIDRLDASRDEHFGATPLEHHHDLGHPAFVRTGDAHLVGDSRVRPRGDRGVRTPRGSAPTAGGRAAPGRRLAPRAPARHRRARRRGRPPDRGAARRRSRRPSVPRPRPAGATPRLSPSSAAPMASTTSPGRASRRTDATASAARDAHRRERRLPTMTGWTNSTATWRPCAGHCGETHHMVAPAANRRASDNDARARSSAHDSGGALRRHRPSRRRGFRCAATAT